MSIQRLPLETLMEILINTDGVSLGKCRRVCRRWREVIDKMDHLWAKMCRTEFEYSSFIARIKSGKDCRWYHLYKNLTSWESVSCFDIRIRDFYKFAIHDKHHSLAIDCGILPLKENRGIVLYDMHSMKHIPAVVPEKDCMKISHNDNNTALLLKSGVLLQRTVENVTYMSEAYFTDAQSFVLAERELYFFRKRDVFVCDLKAQNLESKLMLRCEYDIKEIQYYRDKVYVFTDCGKIVSIARNGTVKAKAIDIPPEWMRQIKHVRAVDDRNFVCYSRNLFKIETDKYKHLYLEFPPITALFFYGDFVLIGTRAGEILLYRLSSQQMNIKPIFEKLAELPEGKFAVQLEVCERKIGPVIMVATFFDIIMLEIDFFPDERELRTRFVNDKLILYKRLVRVRDRLRLGVPSVQAIA